MSILSNSITYSYSTNTTLDPIAGRQYVIKNTGGSSIDITLDGAVFTVAPGATVALGYDGTAVYDITGAAEGAELDGRVEVLEDRTTPGYIYGGRLYIESSGTFQKATYPGLKAVRIFAVGGGGGVAGVPATSAGEQQVVGSAGSGGLSVSWVEAGDLATSETVTIGAGGELDSTGGTTSFGAHAVANGGATGATSTVAADGGAPGVLDGAVGNERISIGHGGGGAFASPRIGAGNFVMIDPGGASPLGGDSWRSRSATVTGHVTTGGRGYGGGATGGGHLQNQGAKDGADGADGVVIVDLYY